MSEGWRDKNKWLTVAQKYKHYSRVFEKGLTKEEAALRFTGLGLPVGPTSASHVGHQYPEVLKEPEWIDNFFEADPVEVNAGQEKQVTMEGYRVTPVRSFAKNRPLQRIGKHGKHFGRITHASRG